MLVVVIVFVVALVIGLPIFAVLGLAGVTHLFTIGNSAFFNIITQKMFAGMSVGALTCIPFFIIAGELMNASGVTEKLIDFITFLPRLMGMMS